MLQRLKEDEAFQKSFMTLRSGLVGDRKSKY
jgi:hypothetical protein